MRASLRARACGLRASVERELGRRLAGTRDRAVRLLSEAAVLRPIVRHLWCDYSIHRPLTLELRGRTTCAFSHFDRDGLIDAHVVYHLAALKAAGVSVIFVSTATLLAASEIAKVYDLCAAIVQRENRGLDFGSWRTALLLYPQIMDSDLLILANDSVYGPMRDVRALLERMASGGSDFWAITESLQMQPHYQSYFLGFQRTALRSRALRRFFDDIALLDDKEAIIMRYEVAMRRQLDEAGLRGDVLIPAAATQSSAENPTLHRWRDLLVEGSPYLKVQLLRENPHRQAIGDWPQVVRAHGLDPDLVQRHLDRTAAALTPAPSGR